MRVTGSKTRLNIQLDKQLSLTLNVIFEKRFYNYSMKVLVKIYIH